MIFIVDGLMCIRIIGLDCFDCNVQGVGVCCGGFREYFGWFVVDFGWC